MTLNNEFGSLVTLNYEIPCFSHTEFMIFFLKINLEIPLKNFRFPRFLISIPYFSAKKKNFFQKKIKKFEKKIFFSVFYRFRVPKFRFRVLGIKIQAEIPLEKFHFRAFRFRVLGITVKIAKK